ncbi:hypothetical protein OEZ85_007678 [Tetradesmus obliquus]|uniref:Helicase ATP-binding domain-containing protein n=1 Tax=Tetradesmus obliquus TaxID=3088 RepID=A0ABY8TGZ3_TETOB|nr:hypothetical protein OEZ85_007678 [Tetradesmus obliquus]
MAGSSQESLQLMAERKVLLLYASWQDTEGAGTVGPGRFGWRQSFVDTEEQQQAAESLFAQTAVAARAFDSAYREQQDFLEVVHELQQLSTFTHIRGSGNARGYKLRPCIAVGVDLLLDGRGRTAREGTVKFTVWTWPHSSPPLRIHRTIDSVPGEAAHHRPWAFATRAAADDFAGQWKNKPCDINKLDRDPWPCGAPPARDADAPSFLTRSRKKPLSQRLLLKLSSGLPLRATLRELLQQQGGDVSVFDEWLQQAGEWDGYYKREKEAAPLLVHLLKTGPQEPAQQPRGFAAGLTLKPHQLQALALMQAAEARPLGFNDVVWREVTLAGRSWWVSLATNKISSSPPHKQATGGILALEMGLGKTLCCLAVILANPAPALGPGNTAPGCFLPDDALLQQPDGDAAADEDAKSCDEDEADEEAEEVDAAAADAAAESAAIQKGMWDEEAHSRTDGKLRICQYHGQGRFKYSEERLAVDFDIVVTTYSILCAEFGGKRGSNRFSATGSPLAHMKWHRIIFDEGHVLKSKATGQSRAVCSLVSDRRWIVTGTPIDSEVEEFHGLLLALQPQPGWGGAADLLRSITVCYTKEVLELPPKTVEDVPVYLNAAEKAAYGKAWRSVGGNAQQRQRAQVPAARDDAAAAHAAHLL